MPILADAHIWSLGYLWFHEEFTVHDSVHGNALS